MLTEEIKENKMCILYASDYHLEMILLPYMKEKINESKFIIFTQNDLEGTVRILLKKLNVNEEFIKRIKELNWKSNNIENTKIINNYILQNEKINIVINGDFDYVKNINEKIEKIINSENIEIINCFYIEDPKIDMKKIKDKYKNILNTKKIN